MVFNPTTANLLQEAYQALSEADKSRLKIAICSICEISEPTFYRWLKEPAQVSKSNRFQIANLFGQDINTLFNPKNK
jgi:hypothetical protein